MGMAGHAPSTSMYHRHSYITPTSIMRLREYTAGRFAHRDDEDIGNLLDESIAQAVRDGHADAIIDDGRPRTVVDLSGTAMGVELYVLCRRDARERREVAMTIMTAEQVTDCRTSGQWQPRDLAAVPLAFAALAGVVCPTTPPEAESPPPAPLVSIPAPPLEPSNENVTTEDTAAMTKPLDDDAWITRRAAATLLGGMNPNYLSQLSTKLGWPKRRSGAGEILYARHAIDAYGAPKTSEGKRKSAPKTKPKTKTAVKTAAKTGVKTKTAAKAAVKTKTAAKTAVALTSRSTVATVLAERATADEAPMYLLRVTDATLGKTHHLGCTESELDAAYIAVLHGGMPAPAISVYRLTPTRLRLELA